MLGPVVSVRGSSVVARRSEDQTIVDEVLERIQLQIGDLRERSGRLSAALRAVSRDLAESGRVPSAPLIADLRRFRSDFHEWPSRWGAGSPAGEDRDGSAVVATSITQLEREFEHRVSVRSALAVLGRLEAIRVTDERDSAAWQPCLDEGRAIRRELAASPPSLAAVPANRLVSGDHPLSGIVTLIADRDELSDERWRTLHDVVLASYGQELATAIARGRLTMPSAETGVASSGL